MRWIPIACCFLYSPLALAVQSGLPASASQPAAGTLVHDGYRLRGLATVPAARAASTVSGAAEGCASMPAAPEPTPGALAVVPLVKDRFFNKFFQGGGRLYRLVSQQQGEPRAIAIHSGSWTLPRMVAALSGQPDVLRRQGNSYVLRVPLLLEGGTSLLLREGDTLRLSRDRGAFIISMGTLHLHKARLEGWDEGRGAPSEVDGDGTGFSPFVVGWSGSRTFISQSTLGGLGFAENLAQGLTLATGPVGLAGYVLPSPAIVSIQDSRFEGMYSAVHASGIPDVRLCRNQFLDSRLHAIHLDGGSSGLILRNRITATRGAYGVYFNKGVHDVKLVENEVSENQRSGISVSESRHILLQGNEVRQNFDAIFVQDSDEVSLGGNRILDNQRHGLSLRNVGQVSLQGDQIGPNRGVGILAMPATRAQAAERKTPVGSGSDAVTGKTAKPGTIDDGASGTADRPLVKAAFASASPGAPGGRPIATRGGQEALATHRQMLKPSASPAGQGGQAEQPSAAWRPAVQKIEMRNVMLEGNHSSALVVEKPYAILLDKVTIMYPGVRRRPVFRGVLNYFESDILKRLQRQEALVVEPGSAPSSGKARPKSR